MIIVVAGMEGALASVVGGLVDQPIIAVPTSIGYGTSFGGSFCPSYHAKQLRDWNCRREYRQRIWSRMYGSPHQYFRGTV